jgi:UDP-glucose 4-epimerase
VSDIAQAHLQAVKLCSSIDSGTFKVYNLGTGKGFSNLEIARSVEQVTGTNVNCEFGSRRLGDPDELVADPTKFIKDTEWNPQHSDLSTIVSTTYNWMKKHEMVS